MKAECYWDVCCAVCGRHRSTDFEKGMTRTSKGVRAMAKREGWTEHENKPICPICSTAHYYQVFANPRHGYSYPVAFVSPKVLTPQEAAQKAKEECYFLCVEDADYLEDGSEITLDDFLHMPSPDEYIEAEYGEDNGEEVCYPA